MNSLKLSPVFISVLLMAAHFYRAGLYPLVCLVLMIPTLLLFKRRWGIIIMQIVLLLGSVEWLRTLINIAGERQANGMPWTRLAVILGIVALFTACSALVFRFPSIKKLLNQ